MGRCTKIISLSIIVLVFITFSILSVFCINYKKYDMPYIKAKDIKYTYEIIENTKTQEELISQVSNIFDYHNYRLNFKKLEDGINGRANLLTNVIDIKENSTDYELVTTLAHEISHLKYRTTNERFCNFEAFKKLYESGDKFLICCAMFEYELYLFLETNGWYDGEYAYAFYVQDYLEI